MRYFEVRVNHTSTIVTEVFKEPSRYDWSCSCDGVTFRYVIIKDVLGSLRNWFERGTTEIQYHARNQSKTGYVSWTRMAKRQYNQNRKTKAIQAKMEKLL